MTQMTPNMSILRSRRGLFGPLRSLLAVLHIANSSPRKSFTSSTSTSSYATSRSLWPAARTEMCRSSPACLTKFYVLLE